MITEKTYLEMKEIIAKHEAEQLNIHNVVNNVSLGFFKVITSTVFTSYRFHLLVTVEVPIIAMSTFAFYKMLWGVILKRL